MKSYLQVLDHVLTHGKRKEDRTGTGTLAVFGYQWRHNMSEGFPLLTTKKIHWKSLVYELLWYLRGDTNIQFLKDNGVTIWDEWADKNGDVGPLYGKQWVKWNDPVDECTINQIRNLIKMLLDNPDSRRMVVSAWNVAELSQMKLPPCHVLWQTQVQDGRINLHLFMRSLDIFLGLPFDIGLYALMMKLLANFTGYSCGELLISVTDLHLYANHIEQAKLQLTREPKQLPLVRIVNYPPSIFDLNYSNFELLDYNPAPSIKAQVAV